MIRKEIVDPGRLRRVPKGFGWVDHRLVREGHARALSPDALALYLFLATVADSDGVSWYSDETLDSHLGVGVERLRSARKELLSRSLLAWRRPFHQVLEIPRPESEERRFRDVLKAALTGSEGTSEESARGDEPISIGEALAKLAGGSGA